MSYEVLTYGRSELRQKALHVGKVTPEICRLCKDMLTAMYASNGLGLAAEQIGRRESICVIDVLPPVPGAAGREPDVNTPQMPLVMINPEILSQEGAVVEQEGCLSFPEIFVKIKRSERVVAGYTDMEGQNRTVEASGLLARAIQHEIDHLNGILLVDRMSALQKVALAGKLRKLKAKAEDTV